MPRFESESVWKSEMAYFLLGGLLCVDYYVCLAPLSWVFLGVAETIVSSLLSCGVGIVEVSFQYFVLRHLW